MMSNDTGYSLLVKNLRVDFPGIVAVNRFSLALKPGDICGLIGPNGAGKTTTFRAIVGLLAKTEGHVEVCGYRMSRNPGRVKALMGFMPDDTPVYEDLKVWEYLEHFALAYKVPRMGKRIHEVLELSSLTDKRNANCSDLSRGMRQRLILAKVLLHDPKVLLLDEPASGLDPNGRIELRKLLQSLASQGKTIVVSSHILTELSEFCNQVAIMEKGRLIKGGGIDEIASSRSDAVIHLKWRNPKDQVEKVLNSISGLKFLESAPYGAKIVYQGNHDQLDTILKVLVKNDIRLTEWRIASADLEQIYIDTDVKEVN